MYVNHQKSEFSVAFIHAVASVAGYAFIGVPQVDDDSVDLTLGANRQHGTRRKAPRLDIQAKCTDGDNGGGDALAFRLPLKNYDDLRDEDVHVPRVLLVLCIPKDAKEWLHESPAETAMRRVAYWLSLRSAPDAAVSVADEPKKTIHVPRVQRFTVEALRSIMTRIGEGGFP